VGGVAVSSIPANLVTIFPSVPANAAQVPIVDAIGAEIGARVIAPPIAAIIKHQLPIDVNRVGVFAFEKFENLNVVFILNVLKLLLYLSFLMN
jgi:hypothetical protein